MLNKVRDREVNFESFSVNKNIIYALKQITGDSETAIITHFYEIGVKLFNDAVSKKKLPQRCHRKIKIFYKNADIQLRFEVYSGYLDGRWDLDRPINISMSLNYTNDIAHVKGDDLLNSNVERAFSLSNDEVIVCEKPTEQLYACLKRPNGDT